jgi:hypothetical protein
MRDANRVYLVGTADCGFFENATTFGSTVTMRLLKGNEVLEVDDVLYVEADEDSLASAWDEHMDMLAEDDELEGVSLLEVSDEEADRLYALRMGEEEGMEG